MRHLTSLGNISGLLLHSENKIKHGKWSQQSFTAQED